MMHGGGNVQPYGSLRMDESQAEHRAEHERTIEGNSIAQARSSTFTTPVQCVVGQANWPPNTTTHTGQVGVALTPEEGVYQITIPVCSQ